MQELKLIDTHTGQIIITVQKPTITDEDVTMYLNDTIDSVGATPNHEIVNL